jgi:hypothetical protein
MYDPHAIREAWSGQNQIRLSGRNRIASGMLTRGDYRIIYRLSNRGFHL